MIPVVAAVIEDGNRFLVTRRLKGTHLEGLWEFPGGKVDADESHDRALRREMVEELGADVDVGELILTTTHAYADRAVVLYFYRCRLLGAPTPQLQQEMRWVARADLGRLGFPDADTALIERLTGSGAS